MVRESQLEHCFKLVKTKEKCIGFVWQSVIPLTEQITPVIFIYNFIVDTLLYVIYQTMF